MSEEPITQNSRDLPGKTAGPDPLLYPETFRDNVGTLESRGELGVWFAGLYKAAVAEEPALANIEIKPGGSSDNPVLAATGGHATPSYKIGSARHEITVNTEDGWAHYEHLLTTRQTSAEASADKAGIPPGQINAKQLASFIFLHELGHIVDYNQNAPDEETFDARRKADMDALPIPGFNPVQLIDYLKDDAGKEWFSSNQAGITQLYGVTTPAELAAKQEAAYHSIETEDIPDQFAVRVMKKLALA